MCSGDFIRARKISALTFYREGTQFRAQHKLLLWLEAMDYLVRLVEKIHVFQFCLEKKTVIIPVGMVKLSVDGEGKKLYKKEMNIKQGYRYGTKITWSYRDLKQRRGENT